MSTTNFDVIVGMHFARNYCAVCIFLPVTATWHMSLSTYEYDIPSEIVYREQCYSYIF